VKWTDEKQRFVRGLWPTHSASAIVAKFCLQFVEKCNRNMVIGIVHRMQRKHGLEKKGTGTLPKVNTRGIASASRTTSPRLEKVKTMQIPEPAPSFKPKNYPAWDNAPGHRNTQPCTIVELDHTRCHWPLGNIDEVATLFCGAAAADGWPYCPHHTRMAYQPPKRRDERLGL
jgi:GcrA cell cycle regulator